MAALLAKKKEGACVLFAIKKNAILAAHACSILSPRGSTKVYVLFRFDGIRILTGPQMGISNLLLGALSWAI